MIDQGLVQLFRRELREVDQQWMPIPISRSMKPYKPTPLNHPACCIGMLIITFPNDKIVYGCATLIYRNIIITSASNVHSRQTHSDALRVVFSSSTLEGGVYHASKWHYPQQFKDGDDDYNVAVLELNECVSDRLGFLGVNFGGRVGDTAQLFGYRVEEQRLCEVEAKLYHGEKALRSLNYESKKGWTFMEGTPLLGWTEKREDIEVVGIYTGNNKYVHLNEGLLNRLKEKLTKISSERIVLWDKKHPKEIVAALVSSGDNWHKRLFILCIFHEVFGPQCPSVLNRVQWTTLRNLNLWQCGLLDQDIKTLSRGYYPCLDKLYLANNPIGNQGVAHIARGSWRTLSGLYLWGTHVTIKILYILVQCGFSQLRVVELNECPHGTPNLIKHRVGVMFKREIGLKV